MTTPTVPAHVPPHLVVDFDLYDHSLAADLQGHLKRLRETTPIAYSPLNEGHWIITRYEDITEVLRDPATYSSYPTAVPRSLQENTRMIPIAYDPPEHTAYRELISPRFTPNRMRELEQGIRDLVIRLVDDFAAKGSCEFVADFARPLPTTVFLMLMGWPIEDGPQFVTWATDILIGKPGGTPEESDAVRGAAIMGTFEYFTKLVADRRENPRDDFTTELINGMYDGERPLDHDELLRTIMLLMLGGLHTVQSSLAYSIIYFAEHPEVRDQLAADPSQSHLAVEEMLRWEAPAWPARRTLRPVTLGGIDIPADEMLLLAFTAANHDESEFVNPDAVDLDRHPNRHLTFSAGPHRCVGSHLARLEMRIAFEELHKRVPNYRLDPAHPPARHIGAVNGVEHVHLVWP